MTEHDPRNLLDRLQGEDGHSYAGWSGGSILAIILIVLLLIWLL